MEEGKEADKESKMDKRKKGGIQFCNITLQLRKVNKREKKKKEVNKDNHESE
jgi:hypothetical protein